MPGSSRAQQLQKLAQEKKDPAKSEWVLIWDPKKKKYKKVKKKPESNHVHNFHGPSGDNRGDPGDTPFTTNY